MKKYFVATILFLSAIQLISVEKINPQKEQTLEIKASPEITSILKKSCYDCHSNETVWPGYSTIAPFSWYVYKNVTNGRKAINFSEWNTLDDVIKLQRMQRAVTTVQNGMMPKPLYLKMHPEAKLSDKEKEILVNWIQKDLLVKINYRIEASHLNARNAHH